MESRHQRFLLMVITLLWSINSFSQNLSESAIDEEGLDQIVVPDLERRVIKESEIDSEDFEIGGFAGAMNVEDFGTSAVYGVRLAYHMTEDFFLAAAAGITDTNETSFETLSGSAQLLEDDERELTFYNLSIGYNIMPGEMYISDRWAFNTVLYMIAGAGSTDFAGNSYFTYNFGAGYRVFLTDWMTVSLDVRDHVFDTDLLGEEKTTHNLETHFGFTVFF